MASVSPASAAVVSAAASVDAGAAVVSAVPEPPQAANDNVITPAIATLTNLRNFIMLSSMKFGIGE